MENGGIYRPELSIDGNFTIVPNAWIRDEELGAAAKLLLIYLVSHQVGYEIRDPQIIRETGLGRHALRSARTELEESGWLVLSRGRNADNTLGPYRYEVAEARGYFSPVEHSTVEDSPDENRPRNKKTKNKKTISNKTNELDIAFEQFWAEYPRKKDKGHARKAFEKALDKTSLEKILEGVRLYAKQEADNEIEFIAYPATWLNGERWEDEYDVRPVRETPGPGRREWVKEFHNDGDHWACEPGEFEEGCF